MLHYNLYPSRIVTGELMLQGAIKKDVPVLLTDSTETEALKLSSYTYLEMRATYLNELAPYAETYDLDA